MSVFASDSDQTRWNATGSGDSSQLIAARWNAFLAGLAPVSALGSGSTAASSGVSSPTSATTPTDQAIPSAPSTGGLDQFWSLFATDFWQNNTQGGATQGGGGGSSTPLAPSDSTASGSGGASTSPSGAGTNSFVPPPSSGANGSTGSGSQSGGQGSPGSSGLTFHGNSFSAVEAGLANANPVSNLQAVGTTVHALEGSAIANASVATFTDADPGAVAGDFSAMVNWGDGTPATPGVVTGSGGNWTVSAGHTFATAGTYSVTTTIADMGGATTVGITTAVVDDAPLTANGTNFNATQGTPLANVSVATFTDAVSNTSPGNYSASIDWGDGSTQSAGVVSGANGAFSVSGGHTYAQDGAFPVTVSIADSGGASATAKSMATVANTSLTAGSVTFTPAVEGSDSTLVATFTDAHPSGAPGDYTATIDWGDGDSTGSTVTGSGANLTTTNPHTYSVGGSYAATVTFADPAGASLTETGTVIVPNAVLAVSGATAYAASGVSASNLTVATFTDPNVNASPDDFSATINWGDGTAPSVGTVTETVGTFAVSGGHSYVQTGVFTPTVSILEGGNTTTVTGTVAVTTISATANTLNVAEGSVVNATVATFSDSQSGNYTATIDWGDGSSPTAGTITANSGYSVSGTHTFGQGGVYPITVTIVRSDGAQSVVVGSATVSDTPLTATGNTFTLTQGSSTQAVVIATFTDPGPAVPASSYLATVSWGDGTDTETLIGIAAAGPNSTFTLTDSHPYFSNGSFPVAVTISSPGGSTVVANSTATVVPGPLSLEPTTISATEGVAANNVTVATLSGPGSSSTATIDWGDGSPATAGTITASGGLYTVTGSHTYASVGNYTVTVSAVDSAGDTDMVQSPATVADAALSVIPTTVTATQGQFFTGTVATFTDGNPSKSPSDYSATINWGDGAVTAGTITDSSGNFTISGSNTYLAPGSAQIQVTISDTADGTSASAAGTATISGATLSGTGANLNATQGVAMNMVTVATFTDAYPDGLPTNYTAVINWGDGSAPTTGTVMGDNGTFSVSGNHTYATPGVYPTTVAVGDWGGVAVITGTAVVSPTPVYTVATFTDANLGDTASQFSATIVWGDGSQPTAGTVTGANGNFVVLGSHAYPEEGNYPVNVNIVEQGVGLVGAVASNAAVGDAPVRANAPPAAAPAAPTASVQEVDFRNIDGRSVTSDDGRTTYDTPKWTATQSDPLVVVRNSNELALNSLTFTVSDPERFAGDLTITGDVSGLGIPKGMTFQIPVAVTGTSEKIDLSGEALLANEAFDHVTNTVLTINWKITLADGAQVNAGTTKNQLYVLYAAPVNTRPLYATVLQTGCVYNGGAADTDQTVLANTWKKFESLKVLRAGYGPTDKNAYLTYYGTWSSTFPTTSLFLSSGDGNCTAWSKFFIDVLEAQGQHQNNWLWTVNPDAGAGLLAGVPGTPIHWQLMVKQWKTTDTTSAIPIVGLAGNYYINQMPVPEPTNPQPYIDANHYNWVFSQFDQDTTSKTNIPGQGNTAPLASFKGHNLVAIGNALYDPSYGQIYSKATTDASLKEFAKQAVQGYMLMHVALKLGADKHFLATGTLAENLVIYRDPAEAIQPTMKRNANGDDNY